MGDVNAIAVLLGLPEGETVPREKIGAWFGQTSISKVPDAIDLRDVLKERVNDAIAAMLEYIEVEQEVQGRFDAFAAVLRKEALPIGQATTIYAYRKLLRKGPPSLDGSGRSVLSTVAKLIV